MIKIVAQQKFLIDHDNKKSVKNVFKTYKVFICHRN